MVGTGLVFLVVASLLVPVRLQVQRDGLSARAGQQATVSVDRTEPPRATDVPSPRFIGVVVAGEAVDISSKLEGRVEVIDVQLGDTVRRGDTLARLDTASLRRELVVMQAELLAALSERDVAVLELAQRQEKLKRRADPHQLQVGAISEEELATARFEERTASAQLEGARARVQQQQARAAQVQQQIEDAVVRAPFDGSVGLRYLDPGALVTPGKPIIHLLRNGAKKVRFAVPEREARLITVGGRVEADVPEQGLRLRGRIENVAPEVDVASRMLLAIASLEDAGGERVLTGAVVRVRVEQDNRTEASRMGRDGR